MKIRDRIRYRFFFVWFAFMGAIVLHGCKGREKSEPAGEVPHTEAVHGESLEKDFEPEVEHPDMYSAKLLLQWSGSEELTWCDEESNQDPYCDEEWHTQWQPSEGTGYFQGKDYVYSRMRKTWNLNDTLWVYLIETKPADYQNQLNGPLYVVSFLNPPSSETDTFIKLGLKGANGVGPDSFAVVRDRSGEVYLRLTWTETDLGVESSFLEYHSLFDTSRRIRFKQPWHLGRVYSENSWLSPRCSSAVVWLKRFHWIRSTQTLKAFT